jgi:hypothetical protein
VRKKGPGEVRRVRGWTDAWLACSGAERCGASRVKGCLGKKEFLGMNAERSSVHGRRSRLLCRTALFNCIPAFGVIKVMASVIRMVWYRLVLVGLYRQDLV